MIFLFISTIFVRNIVLMKLISNLIQLKRNKKQILAVARAQIQARHICSGQNHLEEHILLLVWLLLL